jgi:hypothetical protein
MVEVHRTGKYIRKNELKNYCIITNFMIFASCLVPDSMDDEHNFIG